ncbi:MAG: replication initiation factor domain-containing protein [Nitrospiraceae bacterium]|nr:replication initiation factor domain-containing protein [Nitrospiraceae bacterium]MBX3235012.1 replication initiation factor domain-containing protein [Nitrospiraceae bacterium]
MSESQGFTQSIDWLSFTVPDMALDEVLIKLGGDWIDSEKGFRGYPVAKLMTQGKGGVGKLGTGAHRNVCEVHVDLSGGIVSQWEETRLKDLLTWIHTHRGHVTRIDVALDDREATVSVATVKAAVDEGKAVTRSTKFKALEASNHRTGVRTGETLYFGSRESQTMLRVYDKRLEMATHGAEDAASYGVRWELEFKAERAQACAKAFLYLDHEDWRSFIVGVLRSYIDFREITREAAPYEKYRAPLLPWWHGLTEGFRRCRLVIQQVQQRLEEVALWLVKAVSPMLAVVVARMGDRFLHDLIYTGTTKWKSKHYALLHERPGGGGTPYVLKAT